MTFLADGLRTATGPELARLWRCAGGVGAVAACAVALAGCSAQPTRFSAASSGGRYFDSRLGVFSSPRVYADGDSIPRGGGSYLVGRPYTIAGRAYYPNERVEGYTVVGTASWYGDAFHGRRTANGEIFDKDSISAAHPTLPLPSYVRVTNLSNGRSMIVRVNDRGPYHGGRVMDVSQRVAEALSFKGEGTARIKVDYVGRASLGGSDDSKLMATLRTDGGPAELGGGSAAPSMLAEALPPPPSATDQPEVPRTLARAEGIPPPAAPAPDPRPQPPPFSRRGPSPVPPPRPYDFSAAAEPLPPPTRPPRPNPAARAELNALIAGRALRPDHAPALISFTGVEPVPRPWPRAAAARAPMRAAASDE